ncbi:hypothetical protein JCM5353_000201 [Sporobolomyces roseus]
MSNNFPPEYREPYHLLDSDPRIDVREARINFRIGIQDALARQRYLELERQIDSLINQHPNNLKSKLSDWKQAFFALVEGPKDEDRYFNLYTTSNFEAIRGEVDSLAGENLLITPSIACNREYPSSSIRKDSVDVSRATSLLNARESHQASPPTSKERHCSRINQNEVKRDLSRSVRQERLEFPSSNKLDDDMGSVSRDRAALGNGEPSTFIV